MLDKIIDFTLMNRLSVLTGALLLITAGTIVTFRFEMDIFAELTAPNLAIMAEASGMFQETTIRGISYRAYGNIDP